MKLVVTNVKKIKAKALQKRLFKTLADKIHCQYFLTLKFDSWVGPKDNTF